MFYYTWTLQPSHFSSKTFFKNKANQKQEKYVLTDWTQSVHALMIVKSCIKYFLVCISVYLCITFFFNVMLSFETFLTLWCLEQTSCLIHSNDFWTFLVRKYWVFFTEKKYYRHSISELQIPGYKRREYQYHSLLKEVSGLMKISGRSQNLYHNHSFRGEYPKNHM